MVTDDERREVAERLRELDYSDLQESLICAYLDALGIKGYEDWIGIAHRLADLIEPPARCPHYHSDRHYCSVHEDMALIDREALLALARWLDARATDLLKINSIDHSRWRISARKEHAMDLMTACSLIREACGEVVA